MNISATPLKRYQKGADNIQKLISTMHKQKVLLVIFLYLLPNTYLYPTTSQKNNRIEKSKL